MLALCVLAFMLFSRAGGFSASILRRSPISLSCLPRNSYTPYSEDDDRLLFDNRGQSLERLCEMLGRGERSVQQRLLAFSDTSSRAYQRLFTSSSGVGSDNAPRKLASASEVLQRIKYDYSLPSGDFFVTVSDRFEGAQIVPFDQDNDSVKGSERQFVFAIPESRIEAVSYRERVVWDRRKRVDLFSGSGIITVIESYDQWHAGLEQRRRERQAAEDILREFAPAEFEALADAVEAVKVEAVQAPASMRQLVKAVKETVNDGGCDEGVVVDFVELSLPEDLVLSFSAAVSASSKVNAKEASRRQITQIDESDIEESFVRGGGAGGQKINKTSSKVVLTHHPTGVTVATQQTRSLAQNRKIARKLLAEQVDLHLNGEESKIAAKQSLKAKKKANAKRKAEKRRAEKAKQKSAD